MDEPLVLDKDYNPDGTFHTRLFYLADGLGSIVNLTDTSGNVVETYSYGSFGKATSLSGSFGQPLTYTGRDWDAVTGLYYYRARYYDANLGRFISEDPIGFEGGINFYAYGENNPLRFRDPLGLGPCEDQKKCMQDAVREMTKRLWDSEFFDDSFDGISQIIIGGVGMGIGLGAFAGLYTGSVGAVSFLAGVAAAHSGYRYIKRAKRTFNDASADVRTHLTK